LGQTKLFIWDSKSDVPSLLLCGVDRNGQVKEIGFFSSPKIGRFQFKKFKKLKKNQKLEKSSKNQKI
jgi:hypothetical protein